MSLIRDQKKIWINGEKVVDEGSGLDLALWSGYWMVGQRGNNTGFFSGEIPLMMVYGKELSTDEVRQHYNACRGRFKIGAY